ncbi:YidC/Oxa1 family membrane protein insertase [Acidimicrobiaceae bacterium]|nr:YidC/Oxa1 family membrane protein insertase [Acidimicrobiaceae bacterium]
MAIIEPFALAIGFLLSFVYGYVPSYGASIGILTVIINIIIFPLTLRQTRSTKRMQDVQPELKRLQKKHKDNKEELNKEIAAFYKEKGINPLGCVVPLLVQMPVWFALFRVLREPLLFIPKSESLFLDLENNVNILFFNMDLQIPASEISSWIERVPYIVVILMVVATALFQQQQITKKQGKSDNPQAQQMQMIGKVMPVFFGFISWTLPAGLVIYFLTGNIFRIGQQALIIRIEDKNETNEKQEKQKEQEEDEEEINQEQDPRKNRKKRRRK